MNRVRPTPHRARLLTALTTTWRLNLHAAAECNEGLHPISMRNEKGTSLSQADGSRFLSVSFAVQPAHQLA